MFKVSLQPCWVKHSWYCTCWLHHSLCVFEHVAKAHVFIVCVCVWMLEALIYQPDDDSAVKVNVKPPSASVLVCSCTSDFFALLAAAWHQGEILTQELSTALRRVNTTQICNDYCLVSLPTRSVLVAAVMAETRLLSAFPGAGGLITISHCPAVASGERAKTLNNMSWKC